MSDDRLNADGLAAARAAIIGNPLNDDQLSRIIRAYLDRSSSNEAVAVKALEWDELSRVLSEAASVCGVYRVKFDGTMFILFLYGSGVLGEYPTRDEAKAAAQADLETRIRSALEPSPAQPVAWPGRTFCERAERNIASLAEFLDGADDKEVARDAALAIRTLLASPASNIAPAAEGLVTVPREPTDAMIESGVVAYGFADGMQRGPAERIAAAYRAMIAAAPVSPSPAPVEAEVREALDGSELQLLMSLRTDQQQGVHSVVEGDQEMWKRGFALSDRGMLAMVSHPRGGTFHITRLGLKAIDPARPAQPGAQNNDVGVGDWNDAIEAARRAAMSAGADEPSIIQISAGGREAYLSGATASERSIVAAIERLKR
jgi:hypothetical protein